jgi:hypothetical protein
MILTACIRTSTNLGSLGSVALRWYLPPILSALSRSVSPGANPRIHRHRTRSTLGNSCTGNRIAQQDAVTAIIAEGSSSRIRTSKQELSRSDRARAVAPAFAFFSYPLALPKVTPIPGLFSLTGTEPAFVRAVIRSVATSVHAMGS